MTTKERAQQVISALPDQATLDDIIRALYLEAKFEHGDYQIDAGQGIDHEQARKRMERWLG